MGLSFTIYSAIRKRLSVEPAAGLFLETVPLFFIGFWFVIQFPLEEATRCCLGPGCCCQCPPYTQCCLFSCT